MESRHLCHKNKNKSACVFVLYHLRTINAQKQPVDHYCACNHFPLLKKIFSELETGNLFSLNGLISKTFYILGRIQSRRDCLDWSTETYFLWMVQWAKHLTYWEELGNPKFDNLFYQSNSDSTFWPILMISLRNPMNDDPYLIFNEVC